MARKPPRTFIFCEYDRVRVRKDEEQAHNRCKFVLFDPYCLGFQIGCGNGLLGIFALKYLNASEIFFQDLVGLIYTCRYRLIGYVSES